MRSYGWKPDLPDARDHVHTGFTLGLLPPLVDTRQQQASPYDQSSLGSCTGNAIAGDIEYNLIKEMKPKYVPSRLFIYYNERVIEHSVNQDAGAMIRDGIKAVNKWGYADEKLWPYNIKKFKTSPPTAVYASAKQHLISKYARVPQSEAAIKGTLAAGNCVIFGFTVYDSFESQAVANTGMVPMPNLNTEQVLGGHAVLAVGYRDSDRHFIVRNSWGTGWGDHGYFYMPYDYLTNSNLADDLWTITYA